MRVYRVYPVATTLAFFTLSRPVSAYLPCFRLLSLAKVAFHIMDLAHSLSLFYVDIFPSGTTLVNSLATTLPFPYRFNNSIFAMFHEFYKFIKWCFIVLEVYVLSTFVY